MIPLCIHLFQWGNQRGENGFSIEGGGGFDYFVLRNEALQISVQPPTERFQQEKKKTKIKRHTSLIGFLIVFESKEEVEHETIERLF